VGSSPADTRSWLAELCDAHLLTEHTPGRYNCHDLLRTYANELAGRHDDNLELRAALRRLLDHYLHTGYAAARLLNPYRPPITIAPSQPGANPDDLADYEQAAAWFATEHAALLAVIEHAAAAGFDAHAWQIAWTTTDFLYRRGSWHDWLAVQRTALEAAQRLSDRSAQATSHLFLGMAYAQMACFADADPHLHTALDLYEQLGDAIAQARTRLNLSAMLSRQNRYTEALHHSLLALKTPGVGDDPKTLAQTLNAIGWYQAKLGDFAAALSHCQRALALQQELGDRNGEASTWDSIGYVHHQLGNHSQAIDCYQRAIDLYAQLGIRYYEAVALMHLGDTHDATGDLDKARTSWQRALATLDELQHPEADQVRAKLRAVG
jgi:tetratricopeptide (TPR) repeat protein